MNMRHTHIVWVAPSRIDWILGWKWLNLGASHRRVACSMWKYHENSCNIITQPGAHLVSYLETPSMKGKVRPDSPADQDFEFWGLASQRLHGETTICPMLIYRCQSRPWSHNWTAFANCRTNSDIMLNNHISDGDWKFKALWHVRNAAFSLLDSTIWWHHSPSNVLVNLQIPMIGFRYEWE